MLLVEGSHLILLILACSFAAVVCVAIALDHTGVFPWTTFRYPWSDFIDRTIDSLRSKIDG